jgi:DNA-binding transcriptional LysR family regulator
MNWNDLRTFLAIAEQGSLAGAARAVQQNHSTVFRRLNALEEDMGVRLFERLPEGYVPTLAGERLIELAQEADNAIQKIERELVGRDLAPSGKVRVTAAPNITQCILPAVVAKLRKRYPQIVIELAAGDSDYDLNRREADIAVRATRNPPEHLIGRKLLDIDWWLCRKKASGKNKAPRPVSVDELHGFDLIGADTAMMRLQVFQWLEEKYSVNIVARANDLSTMAAMASAGVGYALLPSDQEEAGLERLLKIPESQGALWLLTHPDLRNVTRIKVVWDALLEHCAA